jgi:hypothetical protein
MSDLFPKNPSGYVPGAEFVDTGAPYGIKLGIITRVDELELKCDIKILTGGGERFEVDLTQAISGPRSFWGGVPEVDSYVIVGYRRKHKQLHEAVILGYISNGKRTGLRFDPVAPSNPAEISPEDASDYRKVIGSQIRYKRLKLAPGDVGGMSSSGAEFSLSKDVRMSNRAGDLFELRDADRTLVTQSIHRVENESGVLRMSGPARRSGFYLPPDIFSDDKTLKTSAQGYFGSSILQRYTASGDVVFDSFNNETTFPPVTLSNGRQVHYAATFPAVSFEEPDGAGAEPYTEDRLEMSHTTDLVQEVREEIDGFQMDRRPTYIERVLGTLIGNDTSSDTGLQQYGQLLRPKIFDEFQSTSRGAFTTEPIARSPLDDSEAYTTAGAYLMRIVPPANPAGRSDTISAFAMAVSKQGKLFLNVPGSRIEKYASGTKNISAELNFDGAVKARIGASKPDNIALHLTLEGGAVFDFRGSASGAGLQFRTHSSYVIEAQGVPDNNNIAYSEQLQGARESYTSADSTESVDGAKITNVSGGYSILADRLSANAPSGFGLNAGSIDVLSSGKSQYQYAQQVLETIVTGGKTSTFLAGGITETALVGSWTTNVLGGSMSTTVAAGSYSVSVGSGSVSISTAVGAMTLSAAAGAISMTAGLAVSITAGTSMNLTAPTAITLTSAQVLVGGPAAALGVCRGAPMNPPGSPSLDWITGLPLAGSATFRSLL